VLPALRAGVRPIYVRAGILPESAVEAPAEEAEIPSLVWTRRAA